MDTREAFCNILYCENRPGNNSERRSSLNHFQCSSLWMNWQFNHTDTVMYDKPEALCCTMLYLFLSWERCQTLSWLLVKYTHMVYCSLAVHWKKCIFEGHKMCVDLVPAYIIMYIIIFFPDCFNFHGFCFLLPLLDRLAGCWFYVNPERT